MSFASIDNFLVNGLKQDGARPSRFLCNVSGVPGLVFGDRWKYMCKAGSIPSFSVGVAEAAFFGRKLKYNGDRVWDDWTCSVYLDQDYASRNMLESWQNGINTLADNTLASNMKYTRYKGTIDIFHYGQTDDNAIIGAYKLIGAWPTRIGEVRLGWEMQNQIAEFEVSFAFDNCIKGDQNAITGFNFSAGEDTTAA